MYGFAWAAIKSTANSRINAKNAAIASTIPAKLSQLRKRLRRLAVGVGEISSDMIDGRLGCY
jgi:hypothetical protein